MKRTLPLLIAAVMAGCATPPERIKPGISDGQKCTQTDRNRLTDISAIQKRTATRDAWGVFWIGIPMGGSEEHAPEIARLKARCGVK